MTFSKLLTYHVLTAISFLCSTKKNTNSSQSTAVPQSDWKRPAGRPHTSQNDLSYHNLRKMPPSWHWTDHSGGYWQQVEQYSIL